MGSILQDIETTIQEGYAAGNINIDGHKIIGWITDNDISF